MLGLRQKKSVQSFRSLVVLGAALTLTVGALGQQNANAQTSYDSISYSIEPMSLDDALHMFSEQSNLQVLFSPVALAGAKTDGLIGSYLPQDALERLLKGNGLEYAFTSESFVVVRPKKLDVDPQLNKHDDESENRPQNLVAPEPDTVLGNRSVRPLVEAVDSRTVDITPKGSLSGKIRSFVNNEPLVGASISLPKLRKSTVSDENGAYSFGSLPAGEHSLHCPSSYNLSQISARAKRDFAHRVG